MTDQPDNKATTSTTNSPAPEAKPAAPSPNASPPPAPAASSPDAQPKSTGDAPGSAPVPVAEPATENDAIRNKAIEATKNVFDPEIPVNIYELGLIYGVDVDDEQNVKVTMTLTSPACPAAQDLPLEVRGRIAVIPGVKDVDVDITFDPPWSPEKMSEEAKVHLGFDL